MNNLVAGQIFKNYKEVCEWLGVIPASGNTKISHMKEFDRYCTYHKEGNKFIIDSVNEIPLDKESNRYVEYKEYCVDKKSNKSNGVYAIAMGNDLYIGSTISGFRSRFAQHKYGSQQHTKEMLDNGALFQILWETDIMDEHIVREIEQMYIDYFMANPLWNLVNRKDETVCLSEKKKKYKNKIIRVDERQYDLALMVLRENGIIMGDE